jgi:hypothetical protein
MTPKSPDTSLRPKPREVTSMRQQPRHRASRRNARRADTAPSHGPFRAAAETASRPRPDLTARRVQHQRSLLDTEAPIH